MSLRRGDMEKSMMMAAAAAAPFPDDGAGESEQSWMMMSTPAEAASLTMSIDEVSGWVDNPLVMSAVRPAGDDVLPWMTASSSSSSSSPPPLPSSPRFLEVYPHSTKRAEAVDGKPATPDREGCDASRERRSSSRLHFFLYFFNDTATTEIYTPRVHCGLSFTSPSS